MTLTSIALIVLGLFAAIAVGLLVRGKARGRLANVGGGLATQPQVGVSVATVAVGESELLPTAVHFGTDLENPAVTLRPLPLDEVQTVERVPASKPSLGVATRLSALMQAAPSLVVANAHHGRQLMEVVINGELIRAANGDGFRAMAKGANGIKEHARLYETKDLSNLVNAAAVWQLASVVVAQKHLADISEKLTEIKDAVSGISEFLDSARRATIQGTYRYLQQAYEAIAQGELSPAIRGELESCERELLAVQDHLVAELRSKAIVAPKDEDSWGGTESLHKNAVAKYRELVQVVDDLKLCLKTRALSWYVLSLYPGEMALKTARCESIKLGLEELKDIQSLINAQGSMDAEALRSMWNREKTLQDRKTDVVTNARVVQEKLDSARTGTAAGLRESEALLLKHDQPTQLIVELVDGAIKQVRQRELQAA